MLCSLIPEFKEYEFEEYLEVNCLINSRTYGLKIGNKSLNCLVPFADMFNHSNSAQVVYLYDKKREGFVVKAVNSIKEGDEVFIRYREHISNFLFFVGYGFVYQPNLCDEVQL